MKEQDRNTNIYRDIPDSLVKENLSFFEELNKYSQDENTPIYIINRPLTDRRYSYDIRKAFVILIPKHKLIFVNTGEDSKKFDEFILDFLEDAGSLSDKYNFRENLGRSRTWQGKFTEIVKDLSTTNFSKLLESSSVKGNLMLTWQCEQLLSLLLGSINDVSRIGNSPAEAELDKIKKKIILFDAEQTRFIFQEPDNHSKKIRIQGLSGTGKTELLLHKLKELYTQPDSPKIAFSCHNKVLANSLRERVPDFFDFMRIEQQIKWDEKLFCFHAWGSSFNKFSGLYRYICDFYNIPFMSYSRVNTFDKVCKIALENINILISKEDFQEQERYAFDYILLDESQDFPNEFIELCNLVVRNKLYIAGDIFQSIFDSNILSDEEPDYLLNKCYRTAPKTLMLSHSVGMGLFEDKKIRWLSKEAWEACGYSYSEDESIYTLRREPLRRFEDIDSCPFQVDFVEFNIHNVSNYVVEKISDIVAQHPTVKPEDICIVFPVGNDIYTYADYIERKIIERFNYLVNKAYESKESKQDNALFLSNRNNVKGLEFAFVICVVPSLSDHKAKSNLFDRNSIYMALTRSFVQSFLLLNSGDSYTNRNEKKILDGAKEILQHGYIKGKIPSEQEIAEISEELNALKTKPSVTLSEVLGKLFLEYNTPSSKRATISDMVEAGVKGKDWTEEDVSRIFLAVSKAV
ncbi:DEAD/DEAH box helicase [Rodentibacter caecimuris]|nr:UvrD-helicase domain-containing protein [Rodentibacter heylii]QIA77273.1 helicase [Rodentibacter heylii]